MRTSRISSCRLGPVPKIRSLQSGSWSAICGERLDQPVELLLVDQPARGEDQRVVEPRAGGEPQRQRVGHDRDLGRGVAELLAHPVGHRRGEDRDHVGPRGVGEQRLEPGGAVGGRAVLLVHDDRLRRQQLDRRREQPGGDRRRARRRRGRAAPARRPDVAQRRELAVPALRDEQRLTFVERAGLRGDGRSTPGTDGRRRRALADVDEVAHVDPLVDLVVRPLAAAGDATTRRDLVVAGQRVGLGDGRA